MTRNNLTLDDLESQIIHLESELILAKKELSFLNLEKEKRAIELIDALEEIVSLNEEKGKRAAELIIANLKLKFETEEKAKRAAELVIANIELVFQNEEKAKRAAELVIANKELAFQNEEKAKRAVELENANKDLEQFAFVASHDLQEPLRMISSFTQLLERKYKDKLDQDANDYIHFVVDGSTRMQNLLVNLLEFSRVSTRAKVFEKVNVKTLVEEIVSHLSQLIANNNAVITWEELPIIHADESQILRVFQNLIENAIKFKKKTEFPKIHTSCTKQNNMFQFSVTDNGIGIEKQYHDTVFIIFQRLHSGKDYPGTGIGLSICKRIIERHNGTIWFESTPHEGTTFYFTIPV